MNKEYIRGFKDCLETFERAVEISEKRDEDLLETIITTMHIGKLNMQDEESIKEDWDEEKIIKDLFDNLK